MIKTVNRITGLLSLSALLAVYFSSWNFAVSTLPILLLTIVEISICFELILRFENHEKKLVWGILFSICIVFVMYQSFRNEHFFRHGFMNFKSPVIENQDNRIETHTTRFFGKRKSNPGHYVMYEYSRNRYFIREDVKTNPNSSECEILFPRSKLIFNRCEHKLYSAEKSK